MKISIITICYNNEKDIRPTIESVINQTYPEIEYIVVDGASKDNTLEVVKQYRDKISKIISEPDRGIYDAINKGIKAATGEVVGLIHAGDELYDEKVLEKIVTFFQSNNIDALYGHSKIYSADGSKVVRVNKSPEYRANLFSLGWFPSHQSLYAKRELFERFGYYNLKYRIAADYELLFRFLYVHKIRVRLLDEFIIKFKLGGTSTKSLGNIIKLNKECANAWKDNGLQIPFYTIPLKLARKINQLVAAKLS
ncbi:MAG: glycosyltransferase [Bacteroidales bacterium]|nr:glycosyltransferase [Bacteroidales bacterium]